jgi:hypothetical protein
VPAEGTARLAAALAGEVDQLGADETKQYATSRDTDR